MGGDFGPRSIVQACIASLSATPSLHLTLVGQPSLLEELIASHPAVDRARLTVTAASETIGMDEKPAAALRGKPDSSMRVALELLRDGKVQACVSAGNTGALMALSRHVLKTLPGIDRPAMVAAIPTQKGYCQLLDLGANVDCSAEHLFQFAVMGSVAAEALGLSFKPQSDDVRDSPSLDVAMRLHERGANVIATDPQAIKNAQLRAPGLPCDALENAVEGAELVILGTEWTEYRELDPRALGARVATPRIIDARNVLDPAAWSGAGWEYRGMGRR